MQDLPFLYSALTYARRGWPVMPCHGVARGACTCGRPDCASPGKHPRLRHGLHDASDDPAAVRRWWRRWPQANVAVRTGTTARGGLVVLDIDPDHGGERSLDRLVAEHGDLPVGPEVRSGSGGRHLYFAHPGRRVPNSAGIRLGPGLDVRGDGGYVVAPPSRHIAEGRYEWLRYAPPPDLPGWLLEPLVANSRPAPPSEPPRGRDPRRASSWARAAVDDELDAVRRAPVGQRNHTLNRAAFALGQIAGGGHLEAEVVHDLLVQAGMATGLTAGECRGTVRSGLEAGMQVPRHPQERGTSHSVENPASSSVVDLRNIELRDRVERSPSMERSPDTGAEPPTP